MSTPSTSPKRLRWASVLDRCSLALFAMLAGVLGMTGATAAITFPTMKALGPTLGAYPRYPGVHWNLAAGEVMRRVFAVADIATLASGVTAGLLLTTAFALRAKVARPTRLEWIRVMLALALLGVLAYQSIELRPAMNTELFAFIDAASTGDAPTADFHRENFASLHPAASRTLTAIFVLAMASVGAGAWSRRDG